MPSSHRPHRRVRSWRRDTRPGGRRLPPSNRRSRRSWRAPPRRHYEDIAIVARVELDFAADRRHAEGIAVAADACNDARDEVAGLRVIRRTESQRVHRRYRTRTHRKDITQNAADARCRSLVGFDVGGMVVALHLEDDAVTVVDVDHAGVLARALDDARPLGRKRAKPFLRGFVGAMLVPHRREDAKLRKGRLAPDQVQDAFVFVGLEPVRGDQVRGDWAGVGNRHRRPSILRAARSPRFKGRRVRTAT